MAVDDCRKILFRACRIGAREYPSSRMIASADHRISYDSPAKTPALNFEMLAARMPQALTAIRRWVAEADGDELGLLLGALNARMTASRTQVEISGEMPVIDSSDYADFSHHCTNIGMEVRL